MKTVKIDRDEDSVEVYNPYKENVEYRGMLFEPGARMVRWFNQVEFAELSWKGDDRRDDTEKILQGYQNIPMYHGWCRPWMGRYGGITGPEDIDLLVTIKNQAELDAFYYKAQRILDRMPNRGRRVGMVWDESIDEWTGGYKRHDWQHMRRATGVLQALADLGDARAIKIMLRWADEWIEDHKDQLISRLNYVSNYPKRGARLGRDLGWGLLLLWCASRYSFDLKYRNVALNWITVIRKAQTDCGFIQRTTSDKLYGEVVGFWQCYEHSILVNALWEWANSLDPTLANRVGLRDILTKATVGLLGSGAWNESLGGISRNVAHGGSDPTSESVCDNFTHKSSGIETITAHNLFAHAYILSGKDPKYIEMGKRSTPGETANAAYWLDLIQND